MTSGKGGVGKTNVAVNLGIALTKLGKQVLLLDADLGLANVNVILGFEPRANIGDVLSGKSSMDDIIVHHESGLDIIPSTSGIVEMTHLGTEEQLALVSAVDDLAQEYDFLIVDTAAGIGDNVLYFNMAAEEIIVVVDGQPTSMTDAYAVVKVLSQRCGVKEFNVLTNRMPVGSDG
ncbi:MAG: AAA family ATPase, partial [Deltaproteobacteria bacterium]|nr:AAA family ATPase [Deltaproteobacteria bacterium]